MQQEKTIEQIKKEMQTDYPLIPIMEITDEARLLAVAWVEGYEYQGMDIPGKQKLASDIMNYSRRQAKKDKEEIERLKNWVSDLQTGMYVNCVYCGHRYGKVDNTPVSMADILKQHIEVCPQHPMSKLKEEAKKKDERIKELEDENADLKRQLEKYETSRYDNDEELDDIISNL